MLLLKYASGGLLHSYSEIMTVAHTDKDNNQDFAAALVRFLIFGMVCIIVGFAVAAATGFLAPLAYADTGGYEAVGVQRKVYGQMTAISVASPLMILIVGIWCKRYLNRKTLVTFLAVSCTALAFAFWWYGLPLIRLFL